MKLQKGSNLKHVILFLMVKCHCDLQITLESFIRKEWLFICPLNGPQTSPKHAFTPQLHHLHLSVVQSPRNTLSLYHYQYYWIYIKTIFKDLSLDIYRYVIIGKYCLLWKTCSVSICWELKYENKQPGVFEHEENKVNVMRRGFFQSLLTNTFKCVSWNLWIKGLSQPPENCLRHLQFNSVTAKLISTSHIDNVL